MEQLFAVEIWVTLIGAACITGWLIGDWNGSERMRRLIGMDDEQNHYDWEPLRRPEKLAAPHPSQNSFSQFAPKAEAKFEKPAFGPDVKTGEEEPAPKPIYAMPPLAELRMQTEAIKKKDRVWEQLETAAQAEHLDLQTTKILTHYRNGIEALGKLSRSDGVDQPVFELPSVSGPISASPFFGSSGLATSEKPEVGAKHQSYDDEAFSPKD